MELEWDTDWSLAWRHAWNIPITDYAELAGDILNILMGSDKAELSCPVPVVP